MKIKEEYKTILVLVVGFTVIGFVWKINGLLYFSLAVLFVSIISTRTAKNIARLWMAIGKSMGAINTKIILSIFFVFIVIPLSFIKRLLTPTPKQNNTTNWVRGKEEETINFNDPW